MAVVASTKGKYVTDSAILKFWKKSPGVSPPKEISEEKLRFLVKNKKLQAPPIKVVNDQGVTILLALTKATGSNPYGKVVFATPRRA